MEWGSEEGEKREKGGELRRKQSTYRVANRTAQREGHEIKHCDLKTGTGLKFAARTVCLSAWCM
jgi:hypothetical protein